MKINISFIAVAMMAVSSCSKENLDVAEEPLRLCLSTGLSKTTVSSPDSKGVRTVLWSAGDKVSLNGMASNALAAEYDGTTNAIFEFVGMTEMPYRILYPSSMYLDPTHVVLPAVQDAMPGNDDFASGAVPMSGFTAYASDKIHMKHLCAAIKFQWKQATAKKDNDDILYLEFTGGNGEQVSGRFAIDYETAVLTGDDDGKAGKSVRVNSGKSQSSGTSVTNIVIPAGTYSKGFTIRLVDAAGHFMEKAVTSSRTFEAGKVYSFPVLEFEPTGTVLVINTKEELQSWATGTAYKSSGDKVVLGKDIDMTGETWTSFAFDGDFDGLGHSITNLVVEKDGDANFFGIVKGSVRNVVFGSADDASVFRSIKTGTASTYIGPIRSASSPAVVDNVISYAGVEFTGTTTGAVAAGGVIAGFGSTEEISNCVFYGKLKITSKLGTASNIGGIIGAISSAGTVKSCINRGTLEITKAYNESINYGAVAGYCSVKATIAGCINEGSIKTSGTTSPTTGQTSIGGILGYNNSNPCTITDCINRGEVLKQGQNTVRNSFVGGIIGYSNQSTVIRNCVNESAATVKNSGSNSGKQLSMGGIVGGIYTAANASMIADCVNEGVVSNTASGNRYIGGIVGYHQQGDATHTPMVCRCTNTGTISDSLTSGTLQLGGIAGCMSKSQAQIFNCSAKGDIIVPESRLTTCGAIIGIQSAQMSSWSVEAGIKVGGHIVTEADLGKSVLHANNYKYVRGTDSKGEMSDDTSHNDLGIDDLDQNTDTDKW